MTTSGIVSCKTYSGSTLLLTFLIVASGAASAAAAERRPKTSQLEPCMPLITAPARFLKQAALEREVLELQERKDRLGKLVARLLVEPSFGREWVISLYMPKVGNANVELIVSRQDLWQVASEEFHEKPLRKARYSSELDRQTAALVEDVWEKELARTRSIQGRGPCMDGNDYTFMGMGLSCGSMTSCATKGSRPEILIRLGLALRNYTQEASTEMAIEFLQDVKMLARVLSSATNSEEEGK